MHAAKIFSLQFNDPYNSRKCAFSVAILMTCAHVWKWTLASLSFPGSASVWRNTRSYATPFQRYQFPWAGSWARARQPHAWCRVQCLCWCPREHWVCLWWESVECWDMDGQSWWISYGGKLWSASHSQVNSMLIVYGNRKQRYQP